MSITSDQNWKTAKVPLDLWHRAKILAASNNTSLQSIIARGVEGVVEEMEGKPARFSESGSQKNRHAK
jgi:hypothetical protein